MLDPTFERAAQAFNRWDLESALLLCQDHLKRFPKSAPGWRLAGRIHARRRQWNEAETALARAAKLTPKDPNLALDKGSMRIIQGRLEEAATHFEAAERLGGAQSVVGVAARALRAECVRRLGDPEAALRLLGTPQTSTGWLAASQAHWELRRPAEAEEAARAGLALEGDANTKLQLHRLLGEILEKGGRHADAFEQFVLAKQVVPHRYDAGEFRARIAAIQAYFTAERLAALPKPTIRTRRPIFIAGLPRSGTTLLERQLAAHAQGAGAGETEGLASQVMQWVNPLSPAASFPRCMDRWMASDMDRVAAAYLAETDRFATPGVERVADKNLTNWENVGLIAAVFPDATIVHLERDPLDAGISCFERLNPSAVRWSSNLRDIGEAIGLCSRLMAHWHQVLGTRLVHVRYEELVRQPRAALERVLAAAGLPWDDACLAHQRSKPGAVLPGVTLSADQVRKPIYDSSIGRGAMFGDLLQPLKDELRKHGAV
ncbi:MAG: sulfotransferase [Phycisphaerales bacterium]